MTPALADPSLPRKRRNASPSGAQKPPATGDRRRSTCSSCRQGIYTGDATVWGNGLPLPVGLNHAACVQRAGAP